jgi:phosphate:Na+ symporter
MDASSAVTLLGGLGLFLLGIHHLTEGLKGLAGDSLRRALQRLASGRFSAVASGAVFTALIQSSTAAILTVIGFVSAGLVTFSQAIAVIMGATLGTTSTPWLLAIFGFRVRIATAALPILGIGAILWLVAKGRTRSLGAILAGFGLLFTAIDYMQTGMKGVSWNFEAFTGPGSQWILAGIGIVMTIVMQSSTAAAATTLVALNAGSLTFEQGCAMIVGQSIGTTATTALVMIGGSLAVRRAALAHILFSSIIGVLGIVFLGPLAAAADWVGSRVNDPDGVVALAAFSSIFKLAGIAAFYPWIDRFSQLIVRISGPGSESALSRLDPHARRCWTGHRARGSLAGNPQRRMQGRTREDAGGDRPATHTHGDGARRARDARVGRYRPPPLVAPGRVAENGLRHIAERRSPGIRSAGPWRRRRTRSATNVIVRDGHRRG